MEPRTTALGSAADLGLEGHGTAPEIEPLGFLLRYNPPQLILHYQQASRSHTPAGITPAVRGPSALRKLRDAQNFSLGAQAAEDVCAVSPRDLAESRDDST